MISVILWVATPRLGLAASGTPPDGFAGLRFGASVAELRARYPQARLNPDSGRSFEVYMVGALKGVQIESPAAFSFYRGKLVGAQVLLNSANAGLWLENSRTSYGPPDSCDYCESPDMATARWRWGDGTTAAIEGGGMLGIYTAEGSRQHQVWVAGGEGQGSAPEVAAAVPPRVSPRPRPLPRAAPPPHENLTWSAYYAGLKRKIERFIGWR